MKRTKIIMLIFGILLLGVVLVSANGDHQSEIEEGKKLVESKISCENLSDEQLEAIGEHYMEQMHPGEQHEAMHKMMGMDRTEYHKQVHVDIAKMMYCGESGGMMNGSMMGSGGMTGMMQGMMGGNMMGSGGMNTMGMNMMGGSFGSNSWWLWSIIGMLFWIALLVALILLIIWLYKKISGKTNGNGSALEILKKRFAKGEITKKEFEGMKKELR